MKVAGKSSRRESAKVARYEVPGKALKRPCVPEGYLILMLLMTAVWRD
jgi:hypothetical protein